MVRQTVTARWMGGLYGGWSGGPSPTRVSATWQFLPDEGFKLNAASRWRAISRCAYDCGLTWTPRSELQRYLSVSILGREQVQAPQRSQLAKKEVEAWSHVRLDGMRLRVTAIASWVDNEVGRLHVEHERQEFSHKLSCMMLWHGTAA